MTKAAVKQDGRLSSTSLTCCSPCTSTKPFSTPEETMRPSKTRKSCEKVTACALTFAMSLFGFSTPAQAENDPHGIATSTPIKHVIIIVGENRSFDHLFATLSAKKQERKGVEPSVRRHHQCRWHARAEFCQSASIPDRVRP